MSIIFPDKNNVDVVMYTDGVAFTNDSVFSHYVTNLNSLSNCANNYKTKSFMFHLEEGIWYFPFEFRLCIFTAEEILNNSFLDITSKITIYSNTFLFLEKEIVVPPFLNGMPTEYYFDVTFHTEKSIIKLLQEDITLSYKGNLNCWKNSLELLDYIFK
jgi:hypothetical protein